MNNYDRHQRAMIAGTPPSRQPRQYPLQNHNATRAKRARAAVGAIRRFVLIASQLFPK
jgi:hypothetical protein